ncbi:MAG: GNAT family N-acetyltransferase [Lysobacterales bacterium]
MKPATRSRNAIRIRRARAGDLARLVELEHRLFEVDRISARQMRHLVAAPSASVLAAVDGPRIVGTAVVLFRRGTRVARLYSIGVAPERHGQGIGAALLAAVEGVARVHADTCGSRCAPTTPARNACTNAAATSAMR